LKIYVDPSFKLTVEHYPPLINPETTDTYQLTVIPTKVNMEKLLVQAATENIHIRLIKFYLAIKQSNLKVNMKVICEEYNQSLIIHLFGTISISVFINIRNGKIILTGSSGLESGFVKEASDKINLSPNSMVEVVTTLYRHSVLATFKQLMIYFTILYGLELCKEIPITQQDLNQKFSGEKICLGFSGLRVSPRFYAYIIVIDVDEIATPSFSLVSIKEGRQLHSVEYAIRKVYPIDIVFSGNNINVKFRKDDLSDKFDEDFEPARKRVKTDSDWISHPSFISNPGESCQQLFSKVVQLCSSRVNALCILDKVADKNISLKRVSITDNPENSKWTEKYTFEYPCAPLMANELELLIGKVGWQVSLTEVRSLLSHIPFGDDKNEQRSITYSTSNVWKFDYPKITPLSFVHFIEKDLAGLINIATLAKQFAEWKNNNRNEERIRNLFEMTEITAVRLTMTIGPELKTVSIIWKQDFFQVNLDEPLCISEFLNAEMTSRKDIQFLINTLLFSVPGLSCIERFVNSHRNHWVLLPRTVHRVRLMYRFRSYAIDIRFFGYHIVTIQDAFEAKQVVHPTQRKLEELFSTEKRFLEHIERTLGSSGQVMVSPNAIVLNITDSPQPLNDALETIHQLIYNQNPK